MIGIHPSTRDSKTITLEKGQEREDGNHGETCGGTGSHPDPFA